MGIMKNFRNFFNPPPPPPAAPQKLAYARNPAIASVEVERTPGERMENYSHSEPPSRQLTSKPLPTPDKLKPKENTKKAAQKIDFMIKKAADESANIESDELVEVAPDDWKTVNDVTVFSNSQDLYRRVNEFLKEFGDDLNSGDREVLVLKVKLIENSESFIRPLENRIFSIKKDLSSAPLPSPVRDGEYPRSYRRLKYLLDDLEDVRKHELDSRLHHLWSVHDFFSQVNNPTIKTLIEQKIVGVRTTVYKEF